MTERRQEYRGKSWKREREERGRRQQTIVEHITPSNDLQHESSHPDYVPVADTSNMCSPYGNNDVPESDVKPPESFASTESENPTFEQSGDQIMMSSAEGNEDDLVILENEKIELMQFIQEVSEKLKVKIELRNINMNAAANRPEESFFSKLDSSLKKNRAFIKRLRNLTDVQKDSLIKDLNSLNHTKYISEAAAAIVDAKLKMSDVNAAVQISSLLHQKYAEFSSQLLEHWQRVLPMKKDEKITNPSKIRVDLRFFAELISCGVFTLKEGLPMLGNLLTILTLYDKEEHSNINILLSFCRHCSEDYAGLVPKKYRLLSEKFGIEIPRSVFLPADRQRGLRNLLKDYFNTLCKHLVKDFKFLQNMEKQNHRILQTKGELSSERKEKHETAVNAFQKLLANTQQFGDIIDENIPDLPRDEIFSQDPESTIDVHNHFKDGEDGTFSIWEDDDTRNFYESLPDLKSFIPGILFKESAQTPFPVSTEIIEEKLDDDDLSKLEMETAEIIEAEAIEEVDLKDDGKNDEKDLTETLMQEIEEIEEECAVTNTANKLLLDGFLTSLLHCVNREIIDQAAVDFCMSLNTRPNRRKLVRALFLVPRTRLDLLPFYSRFVAILNPCMPDVATDLVTMLKQDFKFHIKKKDQINIESKVKTVRFIGELVKFKVFPKSEALYCLKLLLCDFIHHHIEMACNLLETCGRFLFRNPDSHQRTKVYLEQIMRKKSVMSLDSRYITMIENAFYYCNPPDVSPMVRVERPPMHEYIRKLLYRDLTKNNTEKGVEKYTSSTRVLRQMRKLNWDDSETAAYITKCLTGVWNVKYYNIRCVANLLAGLVAYQENVGPQVVDGVLEFMIADTIAILRPKLKLHETLEDSKQSVQDLINELKPKLVEVCPSLRAGDDADKTNAPSPTKDDGLGSIEEVDEEQNDDGQSEMSYQDGETEGDTDGFSGSQSQPFDDDNEVCNRHSMSQSDIDNDPICDGSQDAPIVKSVTKQVQCAEDEDFMTAFDKMLSDSILHRNQESVKPQVDIVIPMNIKSNSKKPSFVTTFEIKEERPTINFILMTRRGNKQQFKNLAVPVTSELAQNLKDREEAERMEKQHVKLLTLNINERQEEEDYQEMLAAQQRPSVMNLNRDRRQKYHHPKGAPDADLIFGNKQDSS